MTIICILLLLIFSLGAFLIYRKSKTEKNIEKAFVLALASIVLFSIGLEISLFNINFYSSKGYEEINLNSKLADYKNCEGYYTFFTDEAIEIPKINADINYIHIKLNKNNTSVIIGKTKNKNLGGRGSLVRLNIITKDLYEKTLSRIFLFGRTTE